jgi:hypothetical protein
MVTLTRDAVGKVARALITLNGQTTTLEVKNALRNLGFYAVQTDVRNYMLDILSIDGDLKYDDSNGIYRVYRAVVPFPMVDEPDTPVVKSVTPTPPTWTTSGNIAPAQNSPMVNVAASFVHDNEFGDYEVTDRQGYNRRVYYQVTRGKAKNRWSRDTFLPFFDARARKI